MDTLAAATILAALVLLASMASVELGISVAIIEIALGVFAGNVLGITSTPWIDFLAAFAGILLTFLAGAEVDPGLFRQRFRESVVIGGLSFALPFAAAGLFAYFVAGWDLRQSEVAGIALSTTSLAVVYAVLVETGLTNTEIGKV
jgi:Kef-type K+ transport system membrane component KefB